MFALKKCQYDYDTRCTICGHTRCDRVFLSFDFDFHFDSSGCGELCVKAQLFCIGMTALHISEI